MIRGSFSAFVHRARDGHGVQSLRENRASKIMPFCGYVFGSQETLSLPAGQVTTSRSQSTTKLPLSIPRPELLGRLRAAGPLQRLVMLTGLQPDDPRLLLRLRASRPRRTRRAILAREPRLVDHAVLWICVREPGDALLARRAGHHLPVPVHHEAPLVNTATGTPRSPARGGPPAAPRDAHGPAAR